VHNLRANKLGSGKPTIHLIVCVQYFVCVQYCTHTVRWYAHEVLYAHDEMYGSVTVTQGSPCISYAVTHSRYMCWRANFSEVAQSCAYSTSYRVRTVSPACPPTQVQSLRLKVYASPGSKNRLFVPSPRHWQAAYGTHGVHLLSKEDRQVKLKQVGAGNSLLPFKHDDGKDDKYLGFAFVEGLPRVLIVIAEAVAIIGGASIDHDSGSRIPELLKSIGHPLPGDRRKLYQDATSSPAWTPASAASRSRLHRPKRRPRAAASVAASRVFTATAVEGHGPQGGEDSRVNA
jgi:hypothetical protein